MARITIGKRPGAFKKTVIIPIVDGGEGEIEMRFKYRTKKEYAQLIDETLAAAKARSAAAAEKNSDEATLEELFGKNIEADAEFILKIAEGWDLEEAFGLDALIDLINTHGASSRAISDAYSKALGEGRSGN